MTQAVLIILLSCWLTLALLFLCAGGSHTKLAIQGLWNYIAWSPILVPYLLVVEVRTTHFTFVGASF